MAKYIVADFFGAFRPGGLRRNRALHSLYFLSVYFICMPIVLGYLGGRESAWRSMIVQYAVYLPMLFSDYSVYVHSARLPKIMYLCPMNPEERRNYIYGSYYFRIILHMLTAILGVCIAAANSGCDVISVMQVLWNHLLVAVLIDGEPQADGRTCGMVIGEIIFVVAMVSNVIQVGIIMSGGMNLWGELTVFFLFGVVQLPMEIWYVKYIGRTLRTAVFFESN